MKSQLAFNIFDQVPALNNFQTPAELISVLLRLAYTVAGVLLLVLAIAGGISIISSAGESDSKKMASGKKALTNAILGFLIIFASYWIIQLVEKITKVSILNPHPRGGSFF